MRRNYARDILALTDDELERFVEQWLEKKSTLYPKVERFSGTGDMGRDVVGFCSDKLHEGPWHNYQCKQIKSRLGETAMLVEIAKIIYYSSEGNFSLPEKTVFVTPKGAVRRVNELLTHPNKFKETLLKAWNDTCGSEITDTKAVSLTEKIQQTIDQFDFASVSAFTAPMLLKDPHIMPVLVTWFGADPGPAPAGATPSEVQAEETGYISQLVAVYGDKGGTTFENAAAVMAHADFGDHLRTQRTRYFEAAQFKRYYRDNTPPEYLRVFDDDMHNGVIDKYRQQHADDLARVDAVMSQAAVVHPSGVLGTHARVAVKQGACHHFANEGKMPWKK